MKKEIKWLQDALVAKELVPTMACYCIRNGEIKATNGCVVASHPWDGEGDALIPGLEIEKILNKFEKEDDIKLSFTEKSVVVKAGGFRAVIPALPTTDWNYLGPDDSPWKPIPKDLIAALARIRPFISDNASQPWATCAFLSGNHAYATNNVVAVGAPVPDMGRVNMLLPHWAIDFLIKRPGVTHWQLGETAVSFKWENGCWLRSALVLGNFPVTAVTLVEKAETSDKLTQPMTPEFKVAFNRMAGLIDTSLEIALDKMSGRFRGTVIEENVASQVPHGQQCSRWDTDSLGPIVNVATEWSPAEYPSPAMFRGHQIAGVIAGRTK